ncbi:MAG: hypothetical protein NXY57DRAFT_1016147, partial [Lentinula lateritia]
MTFKSFTSLNDLFDLLAERFRIQPPPGPATLQLRQWTSRKRNIVQFRCVKTLSCCEKRRRHPRKRRICTSSL